MKKKILFVINYFHPDYASTGQLMTELCLYLQQDFNISVISAQTDSFNVNAKSRIFENEKLENIDIIRIKLPQMDKSNKLSRIKYILTYFILANIAVFRQKNVDIIFSISTPPILGGLIGTIGKIVKRCKHVYNIQDFNPEQAEAISYTNKKWVYKMARAIDNLSCRLSDHIITVGYDMKQTLVNRFVQKNVPNNSVINNWTNEGEITPLSKDYPDVQAFLKKYGLVGKFIIMYSGNMGLYYDLENIIKVTDKFKGNPNIAFVFIGDGVVKKSMQNFVEKNNIDNTYFIPFQPKEYIKFSLNAADVHLVVNQKGIKGVSVPSKIYGVLAVGRPILGVLEEGSEAQRIIHDSNAGFVVEPHEYDGIAEKIKVLFHMESSKLSQLGANGRAYLERNLKRQSSMDKYKELFQEL